MHEEVRKYLDLRRKLVTIEYAQTRPITVH